MSDMVLLSSSSLPPSPSPPSHCDYSDWSPTQSIIPTVYLLAFLGGCLGNGLVLWASASRTSSSCSKVVMSPRTRSCSSPPRHSLTDALISSLAVADLCFVVTLPLWAVYTAGGYHWPFGQPLCQLSSFLTALNMYASVFNLSALSVERYWVLSGHRRPAGPGKVRCVLGAVWALSGVLALPALLLRSVRELEGEGGVLLSCQMDYSLLVGEEEEAELWWAAALSLKSTLVGFLLPLVVLLICYCSLAQLLCRHFGKGPRPDRGRQLRLLRVMVTLVMAFFVCWLPLHVNKTLELLLELEVLPSSCSLERLLLSAHPYLTSLAYLNSCLNPLLYAACDPTFRRRCRAALLGLLRLCSASAGEPPRSSPSRSHDKEEEEEEVQQTLQKL